jgi:hypothetical protein
MSGQYNTRGVENRCTRCAGGTEWWAADGWLVVPIRFRAVRSTRGARGGLSRAGGARESIQVLKKRMVSYPEAKMAELEL